MLEGAFNRKLKRALETHPAMKDCLVLKHNDATTGGIPDFSISNGYHTIWIEVKMQDNNLSKLQMYTLKKLRFAGQVVYASKNGKQALIFPSSGWEFDFEGLVEEIVRRCVNV
jgi:hypothetical protein